MREPLGRNGISFCSLQSYLFRASPLFQPSLFRHIFSPEKQECPEAGVPCEVASLCKVMLSGVSWKTVKTKDY
jgi:hypothetical protein